MDQGVVGEDVLQVRVVHAGHAGAVVLRVRMVRASLVGAVVRIGHVGVAVRAAVSYSDIFGVGVRYRTSGLPGQGVPGSGIPLRPTGVGTIPKGNRCDTDRGGPRRTPGNVRNGVNQRHLPDRVLYQAIGA